MSAAVSSFQNWRERRQARHDHEQLVTHTDEEEEGHGGEEGESHPLSIPTGSSDSPAVASAVHSDEEDEESSGDLASPSSTTPMMEDGDDIDIETGDAQAEDDNPTETTPAVAPPRDGVRRTYTLADLEEEREMARRRTSFCVLFSVFILFRLWIQAVATGDFFLLMLCLMGTSWTARFIRHTREREEELDRLIANYSDGENGADSNQNERLDRDMQRISFQAQLAMAIINSQRDMMQGGFGNPDGNSASQGVSEEAKGRWDRFQFQPNGKGYGSLSHIEDLDKASKGPPTTKEEEEPHCSICLGEYEEGENLVCLPCKHLYHEDCISSWCSNHIRCPLCNLDLESVSGDTATMTTASSS